jgi:hypothetical protein
MRTALVSLIALVGLASAAQAQQGAAAPAVAPSAAAPASPAPPPAAPPPAPSAAATAAPAVTAPAATVPAAAAPAATAPAPAATASAPAAAPAPTAAEGAPASSPQAPVGSTQSAPQPEAAANPTLPTTGDGAVVLNVLQTVCVPSVKAAGGLDARAKALGMKKNRDGVWSMGLGGDKAYTLAIQPQGSNKNVCQVEIHYAVGAEKPIITALNIYAFLHQPEMPMQRNDFIVGQDNVKRVTLSWEYYTDKESTGLVLVQQKKADGTPLNAKFDTASLLYSERTF